MRKIKLDDIDDLHFVATELGVITYLQSLLYYNQECNEVHYGESEIAFDHSRRYLWERQIETVKKLNVLLKREGFAPPEHSKDC